MEVEMEETERPGLHPAVRLTEQQRAAGFEHVCPHAHEELQIARPVDLSKVPRPLTLADTVTPGPLSAWGQNAEFHFPREHRVVDPRTGGMKNQKAVRPDLVPFDFMVAIDESWADPGAPDACAEVRGDLVSFWRREQSGRDEARGLLTAAKRVEFAVGGSVAVRTHLAALYGAGALKYSDDNWKKGYAWSHSYSAALRHLDAIERGEMVDKESFAGMGIEVLHWAAVWFHCAALWTFATKGLGTDDRPKPPAAAALKVVA
jgi:hypothetical protein